METPPPRIQRQPSEVEAELKLALQEAGLDFSSSLEAFYRRVDPSAVTVEQIARWFESTRALRSQLLTRRKSKIFESSEQTDLEPSSQESNTFESVHERLQKAADININSSDFKWERLVSLHTTEHANDTEDENTLDATSPASLEVNVNSGGIVYFAVFQLGNGEEAAACLKFTPSRLTTQSERLGYELGRHLGVSTPQARIVRSESKEWSEIIAATENVKLHNPDCVKTCDEMLEALDINRCLLLMGYVSGCPLHKCKPLVLTQAIAQRIAGSLGRVLLLDLVLRNEDRLPCQQLGWRGNPENLLCTERTPVQEPLQTKKLEFKVTGRRGIVSGRSVPPLPKQVREKTTAITVGASVQVEQPQRKPAGGSALYLVAIDSGVPRRPPGHKRELDRTKFPRFVEMVLHDFDTACEVVKEISSGYLETNAEMEKLDMAGVTNAFRSGFQAGLKAMVPLRSFLLRLQRRLDFHLRQFVADISEKLPSDWSPDKSSPGERLSPQPSPPTFSSAGGVSPPLKLERRFTLQLKDYNKLAKVDDGIHDRVEHWDEVLGSEGHKLCQAHDFSTGFLEGGGPHSVVDSYELKVRLEHVLERMEFIAQGTETERPFRVLDCLYVGGALAAKSVNILEHIGITHILCLCPIEVGSPEPEVTEQFKYKTCQVLDIEEEDIASHFEEACRYIEDCEKSGGKALVHCFEGKSRSATIVLAYMVLAKGLTLLDAWNLLKGAHPRAQPNDGFMKALGELDKKLHGGSSMDWQQRKPAPRLCPLCQKNVGLSSNSLQQHIHRYHPE